MKSFVCPPVRDPVSPPQHPAIPTIAGLAARRTDSFRVWSGTCRADKTVSNRHGDTGHCFGGTEARNRFAPYSKGNSPIRGKADLKIFVCPPVRDPASPPQQPAILTVAGLAARRTDLFGVRSELFQVDGAVNVRGYHSLFRRSSPPNCTAPYSKEISLLRGKIPGNIPEKLLENPGFCLPVEERNVTSGRKNFDLFIRSLPGGNGYSESRYRFASRRANSFEAAQVSTPGCASPMRSISGVWRFISAFKSRITLMRSCA